MGNESSRLGGQREDASLKQSRFSRFRRRFRSNGHRPVSDPLLLTNLGPEDFVGVARIEIINAKMKFRDRWIACLSIGERTYRTEVSDQLSLAFNLSTWPAFWNLPLLKNLGEVVLIIFNFVKDLHDLTLEYEYSGSGDHFLSYDS